MATSLRQDHALALAAAREAGEIALHFFRGDVKSWNKKPNDPVSEADIAVDTLLSERLSGARPDYGWLSEESGIRPGKGPNGGPAQWIIDPIDGTRAFLERKPEFTICIALMHDGQPVLAAIYNPASDEMFDATAGGGARLNGKPIQASGHASLMEARFLASRRTFERHGWLARTAKADFAYRNSIAYRMALVAAGRFDAAISLTEKSDWDVAAADLLVREAGGRVTTADGAPLVYGSAKHRHPSVIATGAYIFDDVVDLLKTRKP
ncbi:MAG: 3'(2'),5'-bisphosphate nucleotidase CysQ [Ferrovibrio sp.]|uniref:inositol monophosphatase family protein n=1 Tax=Ferrovibrio sp. TaxID=1917215 RepID=UPI00261FF6D2|nr:3'(2'),5'-bisphosphate nucleotidase CysQ [Ferrovibrio sp.]MCW0232446.1 3'(2'),5'-bisphosphate nucleotidase CysQ [Ferrovibrio sp.]